MKWFPSVPGTLKHRAQWTRDGLAVADDLPPLRTSGQSAPFLGLKSRISQIWLNRWTVLLLLVLVRVILLLGNLNNNIAEAKIKALSACTKVEDVGSAFASMPHYLSVGVNKVAAEGIEAAVDGLVSLLMMLLTAVENIVYFVINFYVGTYVCLIAAFIHGAFDVGIGGAQSGAKLMNDGIHRLTAGFEPVYKDFATSFNDLVGKVNFVPGVKIPTLPDFDTQIGELQNIKIDPTEFVQTLATLKDKTPTFDDVQKAAKDAIAIPFDLVRKELNSSAATWALPKDMFPVAQKEALTFCSDNTSINDFFNGLFKISNNAKIAFLVVIPILAILVCVPMYFMEVRGYRRQKALASKMTAAQMTSGEYTVSREYDAMDVIYQASRPRSSRFGVWLGRKFKGTNREYVVRWAWAYCTSLPALFVLSLAIAGLFSCFCQWIVLSIVQKEAPGLINEVGEFADGVVKTLEGVSQKWATDANSAILKYNGDINDDVLGKVRVATSAVNSTLVTFNNEMNKKLDSVFAGTVLQDTVKNVVRCLIGLKIEAVEKGLTWVHEQARVSFPLFPSDIFSAGTAQSVSGDSELTSFLASPSSVTTDEITGAVNHVVDYLRNGLLEDAFIATGLMLVYVILVLVGIIRALLNIKGPRRTRGDGVGMRGKKISGPTGAVHHGSSANRDVNPFADPVEEEPKDIHDYDDDSGSHRDNTWELTDYGRREAKPRTATAAAATVGSHARGPAPDYDASEKGYFAGQEDEEAAYPSQPPAAAATTGYPRDHKGRHLTTRR